MKTWRYNGWGFVTGFQWLVESQERIGVCDLFLGKMPLTEIGKIRINCRILDDCGLSWEYLVVGNMSRKLDVNLLLDLAQ